jgi:predicted O-methyltransferase YrrM
MIPKKAENTLQKMAEFEQTFSSKFAVDDTTGNYLYNLVKEIGPSLVLELGTWRGASSIYLASALKQLKKGKVVTVDFQNDRSKRAAANFKKAGVLDYIEQNTQGIDAFLKHDHRKYELIFMDAAKKDQGRWLQQLLSHHVRPGTIIIVDDVDTMGDRMEDLFLFVKSSKRLKTSRESIDDGLLIIKVIE